MSDVSQMRMALDCHLKPFGGENCAECAYRCSKASWVQVQEDLVRDVVEYLAVREPRMLTFEEAVEIKTPGTLVWLEVSGGFDGSRYKALPAIISDNTHGLLPDDEMRFYNAADRAWSGYNKALCGWRLWTAEPSDKQRLAAKWDDD